MNWWEMPEWVGFTRSIIANPDDNTARLVAADWLDERDDLNAKVRAQTIREQVNGIRPFFPLRPGMYTLAGFPETGLHAAAGLVIDRGFPVWAVFLPHQFRADTVGPAFMAAPLTTVSALGMCALHSHGSGGDVYSFFEGPEHRHTGEFAGWDGYTVITRAEAIEMARDGRNPHAEVYREAGYIPAGVYVNLPFPKGNRAARQEQEPQSDYPHIYEAAQVVLKAAWRCGRSWALQSDRIGKREAQPEQYAVWTVIYDTLARQPGTDSPLPPVPSCDVNPFTNLAEAQRAGLSAAGWSNHAALYGADPTRPEKDKPEEFVNWLHLNLATGTAATGHARKERKRVSEQERNKRRRVKKNS